MFDHSDEKVVVRNFRHTTPHGAIERKTQEKEVKHYNLNIIISVGNRVKLSTNLLSQIH